MSQVPTRFTSGFTPDNPNQPLANCGAGNPAFYHEIFSDFDDPAELASGGLFEVSASTTGTAALSPNDGGTVVLTTANTSTDFIGIAPANASFLLDSGKRQFAYARFKTSSVLNMIFLGFTSDPLSSTDGLFAHTAGGTLDVVSISTSNPTGIKSVPFTLSPDTYYDLCLEFGNGQGALVTIGQNLVGQGNGKILAQVRLIPEFIPTVLLKPFFVLQSADTSTPTATVDFLYASKER